MLTFAVTVFATGALLALSLTVRSAYLAHEIAAASLAFGLCICALLLHARRLARESAARDREIGKQHDIISLLLSDFNAAGGDWLWETDAGGRLTYISGRFAQNAGLGGFLGKPLSDMAGGSAENDDWRKLRTAMAARAAIENISVTLPLNGRQVCWRMTAKPILAGESGFCGYRGAAHDVTEDRSHERDLIAAREAAERASARKSQYIQAMSHELRTPLNAIVGFSELLCSDRADQISEAARTDYLRIIAESSRRLQEIVRAVLDATRIDRGTLQLVEQEVDAAELTEVAVKLSHQHNGRDDVTIVAHVVDGVDIRCDVARLKQVLVALIDAAAKASPAGASVEVRLERSAPGGLVIAVSDHGAGPRNTEIDGAFAPFLQVGAGPDVFDGSVSFARKIALLHGGDLLVESRPGEGTAARLTLPAERTIWQH